MSDRKKNGPILISVAFITRLIRVESDVAVLPDRSIVFHKVIALSVQLDRSGQVDAGVADCYTGQVC